MEQDVAQAVEHSTVKFWILLHGRSILHGRCICSFSYFLFQTLVHNWSIKGYVWYALSCMWESAYKRSLAAYRKE